MQTRIRSGIHHNAVRCGGEWKDAETSLFRPSDAKRAAETMAAAAAAAAAEAETAPMTKKKTQKFLEAQKKTPRLP